MLKATLYKTLAGIIAGPIAALSLAAAPALAQDSAAAPAAATTTLTDIDPALWVVKDEDTTIYLFGTVHILRPGLSWFDEAVRTAFDASDTLMLEVVEGDPADMQALVQQTALDASGTPLRDKLTPEARAIYETALASINMPANAFDPFEPWFAGITLSSLPLIVKGYDINSGAEKTLTEAAKAAGKTVGELESVQYQIGLFDALPEASQIVFLNAVAEAVPDLDKEIDELVDAWGKGDTKALADQLNEGFEESPELYDKLLTQRNKNWARWIEQRLAEPGTVFVAVGAGHLAGPDSVQVQLAHDAINAERIAY